MDKNVLVKISLNLSSVFKILAYVDIFKKCFLKAYSNVGQKNNCLKWIN